MQIKKIYQGLNPQVVYDEVQDFVLKQGAVLDSHKLETYSLPTDSSSFIYRGTMAFKIGDKACVRVHLMGSDKSEIRMTMDIEEACLPAEKVAALQSDLDFIFGAYEQKA